MNEINLPFGRLLIRGLQSYWRLRRGLRIGVEALVLDTGDEVAMVRTAERASWHLPGDALCQGDTLDAAMRRVLLQGYGIAVKARPELFWIYTEQPGGPIDKTGLFIVRHWERVKPVSGADFAFFDPGALPSEIEPWIAARVRQALEGRTPAEVC